MARMLQNRNQKKSEHIPSNPFCEPRRCRGRSVRLFVSVCSAASSLSPGAAGLNAGIVSKHAPFSSHPAATRSHGWLGTCQTAKLRKAESTEVRTGPSTAPKLRNQSPPSRNCSRNARTPNSTTCPQRNLRPAISDFCTFLNRPLPIGHVTSYGTPNRQGHVAFVGPNPVMVALRCPIELIELRRLAYVKPSYHPLHAHHPSLMLSWPRILKNHHCLRYPVR